MRGQRRMCDRAAAAHGAEGEAWHDNEIEATRLERVLARRVVNCAGTPGVSGAVGLSR